MTQSGTLHRRRLSRALGFADTSEILIVEQFGLIAKQIPVLYAVIIVNCMFMAVLASYEVSAALAFAFPAGTLPVMLYRVYGWRRHARLLLEQQDLPGMRKALRMTTIMANVLAAVLAVWSVVIMAHISAERAAFVPLFTILSMITCAHCLSAYPIAAYSVMVSGSTYIAIAMAATGDSFMIAMAINVAVVTVMVVYMVRQQYGQLRRLVRSGYKLRRQSGQARALAYQDQLTSLPNRRALIAHIRQETLRNASMLAGMIMIDLNGFKPVNDTFGHAAGDSLLIEIAKRLQEVADTNAFVARLGGDEFSIFISDLQSAQEAASLAERLYRVIGEPIAVEGHVLHLGAALGVVVQPAAISGPLVMLQRADIALYEAKSSEGSAISLFESAMEARVKRRTLIEQALNDPAQVDAIRLVFQPIFELRRKQLLGFEALARWVHPGLGPISPAEFITVAERTGKARQLTLHLFRQAVAVAKHWPDHLYLSFNLSGSGLCTAGFDQSLPEILAEQGFASKRLTIEVTETALLADPVAAGQVLRDFQRRGHPDCTG